MKKKKYIYAVSYQFSAEGNTGFGCAQVLRNKKVNNLTEFVSLMNFIRSENKFDNVVIINIMSLGTTKE